MPPGPSPGCVPFSHLLVMLAQLCIEQALGRLQASVLRVFWTFPWPCPPSTLLSALGIITTQVTSRLASSSPIASSS